MACHKGGGGGKYLAHDGAVKVYEGEWTPRNVVILEFPSVAAWESFYNGPDLSGAEGDP